MASLPRISLRFPWHQKPQAVTLQQYLDEDWPNLFLYDDAIYALTNNGREVWRFHLPLRPNSWEKLEVKGAGPAEDVRDIISNDASYDIPAYYPSVIGDSVYVVQQNERDQVVLFRLCIPDAAWTSHVISNVPKPPTWYCPFPEGLYICGEASHAVLNLETLVVNRLATVPQKRAYSEHFLIDGVAYCGDDDAFLRFDPQEQKWLPLFAVESDEADILHFVRHNGCIYGWVLHNSHCSFCFRFDLRANRMEYVQTEYHPFNVESEPSFGKGQSIIGHQQFFYLFSSQCECVVRFEVEYLYPSCPWPQRFASLYNSPLHSDVQFAVQGATFFAHKALLHGCPVFRTMFSTAAGFEEGTAKTVAIDDASAEAFGCFLCYVYTGHMSLKPPAAEPVPQPVLLEVFYLADKYGLTDLAHVCEIELANWLREKKRGGVPVGDLVTLLESAVRINEGGALYSNCIDHILENFPSLVTDEEFTRLAVTNPRLYAQVMKIAAQCVTLDREKAMRARYLTARDVS